MEEKPDFKPYGGYRVVPPHNKEKSMVLHNYL